MNVDGGLEFLQACGFQLLFEEEDGCGRPVLHLHLPACCCAHGRSCRQGGALNKTILNPCTHCSTCRGSDSQAWCRDGNRSPGRRKGNPAQQDKANERVTALF